jgi:hypothetical protein
MASAIMIAFTHIVAFPFNFSAQSKTVMSKANAAASHDLFKLTL